MHVEASNILCNNDETANANYANFHYNDIKECIKVDNALQFQKNAFILNSVYKSRSLVGGREGVHESKVQLRTVRKTIGIIRAINKVRRSIKI